MLPPDSSTPDSGLPTVTDLGSLPPPPTEPVLAPATAGPPGSAGPSSSSGVRGPVLALAMIVVSVVAGGALFFSGWLVGQRSVQQPGTPVASEQAFQPFWDSYDTIMKRFAL